MVKKDNFVGLIILDGFGLTSTEYGNAISIGDPENLYSYMHDYSFTTLEASGQAVGLPAGQMGNSEVGHLNIGAGRVVYQAQLRIQKSIEDDTLKDNKEIVNLIKYCKAGHKLHLMGLLSDIGVHAHMDHLFYLMQVMKDNNIPCVIHAITDGRDSYREDGVK